MQIHVNRNGQQLGPYSADDINQQLSTGALSHSDLAWYQGINNWVPVSSVPGISMATTPPPLPPASPTKAKPHYSNYCEVPYYRKQWFFWLTYFTITPIALVILLFGDVYYVKRGEVKNFGVANRIVAGVLAIWYLSKVVAVFTQLSSAS